MITFPTQSYLILFVLVCLHLCHKQFHLSHHKYLFTHFYHYLIDLVGRVFANGPGDLGLIPGHVMPKTSKMVLDTYLLNTQQYEVLIEGKVEKFRERSNALPTPQCSSY